MQVTQHPFRWPVTTRGGPELLNRLPAALDWLGRSAVAARAAGCGDMLLDALLGGARWIDHPVLAPICMGIDDERLDLQLIWWLADHAALDGAARAAWPRSRTDQWLLRADGPQRVAAGQAPSPPAGPQPDPSYTPDPSQAPDPLQRIALDPFWTCLGAAGMARVGVPPEWSWAATPPVDADERAELDRQIAGFGATMAWLAATLPDVHRWCAAVTQIVFPYRSVGPERFRSSSRTDLPGAIFLDISVPVPLLIEGLVHESAHRHLFRWEADGPLIDPGHCARYDSPLRPDPRPLRGIYLAWHALTYMVLAYGAMERVGALPPGSRELADLRDRARDAEVVLRGAAAHLTDRGRALMAETAAAAETALDAPVLHG